MIGQLFALTTARLERSVVWIYAVVGEYEAAIDRIERLLSGPCFLSGAYLEVAMFPQGLRAHPRFQRLLERADAWAGT